MGLRHVVERRPNRIDFVAIPLLRLELPPANLPQQGLRSRRIIAARAVGSSRYFRKPPRCSARRRARVRSTSLFVWPRLSESQGDRPAEAGDAAPIPSGVDSQPLLHRLDLGGSFLRLGFGRRFQASRGCGRLFRFARGVLSR
jgi:hypothetical protein